MEELILRWIERVGFPIGLSCILLWAMYRLFGKYEMVTDRAAKATDEVAELARKSNAALERNSSSMDKNTTAANEQTKILKEQTEQLKKLGSDPTGWCKAMQYAQSIGCKAEEALHFLKLIEEREKKKEKKQDAT